MAELGKAQTGKRSSTPKICRINADDNLPVIYKNMGNNHACPVFWADTVTVASGTTTAVVASGVTLHGLDASTYAFATATPKTDPGARYWIERDTGANTVTLTVGSAVSGDVNFDVMIMLAGSPTSRYIEDIYCRGNTGASQALP